MLKTDPVSSAPREWGARRARVGIVCDFVEENWPSMDLVADMLFRHLRQEHADRLQVTKICPPLRRPFGWFPGLGSTPLFSNADRMVNRFFDYPRRVRGRENEFDLFHIVDHSYAQLVPYLPSRRTIVTCHDLDTFRCLLQPEREKRPRWFRAMTSSILQGLAQAAHVITVSRTTRDSILEHGLLPAERMTVIPNGVHPSCSPIRGSADEELARLLPSESAGAFWLLNVGSTMRRKRLDILLRVVAAVRNELPGVRLLRVGGALTEEQVRLAAELKLQDAIVQLGSVNREMLAAAYRRADLLVHTAEAEGFGLPVVEAMACGCPVAASDIPVLREVGGEAASYCTLEDTEAWRNAIVNALGRRLEQNGLWERERQQAISHAARFSWLETARQTADVYRRVLEIAGPEV